jgi:methionyl-tRNA formyltransferase
MKRVVLLINGDLGLNVLKYLIDQTNVEVSGVILNSVYKRDPNYFNLISGLLQDFGKDIPILSYEKSIDIKDQVRDILQDSNYGVSALFGHILPNELLDNVDCEIINLHPSLLPNGRGADPIPWSIIDQQKQGVTIHVIDSGLDTGAVLFQRDFRTDIGMNAGQIYEIATAMLFQEFVGIFHHWLSGSIGKVPQLDFPISIHKSADLEKIRVIKSGDTGTFEDFVRKLQALTFADGRKPLFVDESGKLWRINFSLTREGDEYQEEKLP